MAQSGPVVQTFGLTKEFGGRIAVDSLDIEIHEGEVFGLLGPNGSGKSTTVAMLLGLARPTSGTIKILGKDLRENRWEILQHVGAIIEQPAFYPYLSGRDNLHVLARPLGIEERIPEVIERVALTERAGDAYHTYSLGMKQRLGIASTLLRDPRLIVLDEPTNGLDPAGTREVRALIQQLATEGRSVLLCSHLLHEVELVCDRAAILRRGVKLWDGKISDITGVAGSVRLRIDDASQREQALRIVDGHKGASATVEGPFVTASGPHLNTGELNQTLNAAGILVSELIPMHPSLENVFIEITEGAIDLP